MQQIVSLLIFQSPEPRVVLATAPWIDFRLGEPVDKIYADLEAQQHRRSLKSHLPFDALPYHEGVRYIHVARDGLDAFMSWHNHTTRYKRFSQFDELGLADETIGRPYPRPAEDPGVFFNAWFGIEPTQAPDVTVDLYFRTERTWWDARERPNVLMVHYNDLKADLDGEMVRIAKFLEIDTPAALWPSLVDAATFETMKRNGSKILPRADISFRDGAEGFLFQGRNERWREALSESQVAAYRARATAALPPDLERWLAHGREVAETSLACAVGNSGLQD